MSGEYSEKLPLSVGKLIVTKNSWHIDFYFSGPDMRYNGTFFKIASGSVEAYIEAYREAWKTYKEAKEKMLVSVGKGELKLIVKMNLNINVGGYFDGVCLTSYHMPLKSERSIEQFISSLRWAQERAEEVKKLLNTL
ncbi:hypothetical protein D3C73_1128130 [compost metagenome]